MKSRIRKIGALKTAKIVSVLYLIISAVIFEPMALMMLFVRAQGTMPAAAANSKAPSPFLLMLAPVFYCIISFIFTAVSCWLYNAVAGKIGGIEVELDQDNA